MLRYSAHGELHKDFHASTLDGIRYLLDNYGPEALKEVLFNTGTQVYKSIHQKLQHGDSSELLEHWQFFFTREGGKFQLDVHDDGTAELVVLECPALRHLEKRNIEPDQVMCEATRILNDALCSDSPFEIETVCTGKFSCRQTLRLRQKEASK